MHRVSFSHQPLLCTLSICTCVSLLDIVLYVGKTSQRTENFSESVSPLIREHWRTVAKYICCKWVIHWLVGLKKNNVVQMTLHKNFVMKHISVLFNGTQSTCHVLHPQTIFHDPLFKSHSLLLKSTLSFTRLLINLWETENSDADFNTN